MTQDELDLAKKAFRKAKRDFVWCCAHLFKVKNKRGKVVPLVLNAAQLKVWHEMRELHEAGKPMWVLILKARQQGMSTLAAALCAWQILFHQGQNWLTVNYREDKVRELFAKVEFIYDHLPEALKPQKAAGCRTRQILVTAAPLDTMAIAETAENVEIGVSSTFQHAHLTEFPLWKDAAQSIGGFLPTVEPHKDSIIVGESTARAMGDWFHEFWQATEEGRTRFKAVFVAWFETPEYSRAWEPEDRPLGRDELRMKQAHGLSDEQVLWYRDKLAELGQHRMYQEYPTTAAEAFRAAGTPYFDRGALTHYQSLIDRHRTIRTGHLQVVEGKSRFVDDPIGPWRIYKRPAAGAVYVVAADPSGGTARDFSSIDVVDVESLEQVASYRGKMDPDELAYQIASIGYAYNTALCAVEKNGEGRATVLTLHKQLAYPRIFYHIKEDSRGKGIATEWGWVTSPRTRPTMLAQMEELVRKKELALRDDRTLKEMWSFVRVEGSKLAEAAQGGFDDSVMSLAIALSSEVRAQAYSRSEVLESTYVPAISSITGY